MIFSKEAQGLSPKDILEFWKPDKGKETHWEGPRSMTSEKERNPGTYSPGSHGEKVFLDEEVVSCVGKVGPESQPTGRDLASIQHRKYFNHHSNL